MHALSSSGLEIYKYIKPTIISPGGGYTQVKISALRELCFGAGARKAIIWHGRVLSGTELLSGQFPVEGEVLN